MSTLPAAKRTVVHRQPSATVARHERALDWVHPLGSLKLTVVTFALAIVLILVGTLAQVNRDIWEVLEVYFKVWWTWVDVTVLFPRSWFPELETHGAIRLFTTTTMGCSLVAAALTWFNAPHVRLARPLSVGILVVATLLCLSALLSGGFWYPGGALIGLVMCINLLAAHLTRYSIHARGPRLYAGLAVAGLGVLVTLLVIVSGHNSSGFQGEPPIAWQSLWQIVKGGLSLFAVGLVAFALFGSAKQPLVRPISGSVGALLGAISVWLWASGEATYLGDSGMRVLWQLILALLAASVLLGGCVLLFRQRAGVIVLHAGIGLLMFGQWFVTRFDSEEQITMVEGQTVNYGQDIRSVELAVIRRNSPEHAGQDDVLAIPLTLNGYATQFLNGKKIADDRLPFDIEILEYQRSSSVQMNRDSAASAVDSGRNRGFRIVPTRPAAGALGSQVDLASGYFQLRDRATGQSLGTYLLSQEVLGMVDGRQRSFDTETVESVGEPVDVQLRFLRNYKPYSLTLIDVQKEDYLGTDIPRHYSSQVRLTDPSRGVDQELTIWMNNPRRYAGETFYQSGWQMDAQQREYSTLQVVRNYGWMIPYVATMITVVGMGWHFLLLLLRFLDRQGRAARQFDAANEGAEGAEDQQAVEKRPPTRQQTSWSRRLIVPLSVAAAFALIISYLAKPPRYDSHELDLAQFGQLPLVYQGRV
jgi:hypothetical protein